MKIINAMFSKDKGGLEQAFLNYIPALKSGGNQVISVIHPKAIIRDECPKDNLVLISNLNQYDFLAIRRLKNLIEKEKPDCIITHSYRTAYLFSKTKTKVPTIAVCHVKSHYNFGSDFIFALTESMRKEIIDSGQTANTVFTIPNMLDLPKLLSHPKREKNQVPVIGLCSRFVKEKGIDVFIEALAILKQQKILFHVNIAGDGILKEAYLKQLEHHDLTKQVTFLGWLNSTQSFYESIDIFCLPSREEAFGLVILESMRYALPMVLSDLPGPREIIGDSGGALMVEPNNAVKLASALQNILLNPSLGEDLSQKAFQRVFDFSIKAIGSKLLNTLELICSRNEKIGDVVSY